jgi:hypothetical protein
MINDFGQFYRFLNLANQLSTDPSISDKKIGAIYNATLAFLKVRK